MRLEHLNELREKNLITADQYTRLEPLITHKIVSVFFELRTLLYLGVVLFTTGVGILIYENIGDLGHLLSIIGLSVLTAACGYYAFRYAPPYTSERAESPSPYFDYVVLLGCLLFVSVLGYLQFQYSLFDDGMGATTLATATLFFCAAYRFDHLGVLSLAITALASFWGISVSPQKWYSSDFFETANLHNVALVFGAVLSFAAVALDKKDIKKHFTFTYLNFCLAIYLIGSLAGIFMNYNDYGWYLLLLYIGCGFAVWAANWKKSFLFLVYAFVAGYIGTTYFLTDFILNDPFIWFVYLMASCGGFIFFIIRYRNYFKREEA
jgi:hypothetical protein